ncbi:hypothetical protein ACVWXU_002514 [Streptomyces sp. TE33382]
MVCNVPRRGATYVRNQEVRTLMTVVAMGTAHNQMSVVLTPVATG